MSINTAKKGSIVKATATKLDIYDEISGRAIVIYQPVKGEVIGTFQEFLKNNGGVVFAKITFTTPVKTSAFGFEVFGKTYTTGYAILSDISILENTSNTNTQQLQPVFCTGNSVRLREFGSLSAQILTTFNQNDLVGYSDMNLSGEFVKVALSSWIEKSGKTYASGYMHKDYLKVVEQSDLSVLKDSEKTISQHIANLPRTDSDNVPAGSFKNRYAQTFLWGGLIVIFGFAVRFFTKKNNKITWKK